MPLGAALLLLLISQVGLGGLPRCLHNVPLALNSALALAPPAESNSYTPADPTMVRRMRRALRSMVEGDYADAFERALVAGYFLCTEEEVAVGVPLIPGVGLALFAWRAPEDAQPLILEAPHPRHDLYTGRQSINLFHALRARALLIAGTHRCANSTASGCDGDTDPCGDGDGYRESDMAHAVESLFMGMHRFFADTYPDDLVVSLHGMGDSGISLSNGTAFPTTSTSALGRFATALQVVFPDERITSCNDFPGVPAVEQRLCGTTNVQGRHLNGIVLEACTETATQASDRFIHLEQSPAVRSQWELVADALEQVIVR